MLQQMVRLTIAATIWKKYKSSILGLLLLIGFWLLLNFVHQDYLAYAQLDAQANQSAIAYSYIGKWLLIVISALGFIWFVRTPTDVKSNSTLSNVLDKNRRNGSQTAKLNAEQGSSDDDPFANIRRRKKLRSEADFVLGEKPQKK